MNLREEGMIPSVFTDTSLPAPNLMFMGIPAFEDLSVTPWSVEAIHA